jgi:hypothetical protein
MDKGFDARAKCVLQPIARRPEVNGLGEISRHRSQPLFHVLDDAIEQKRDRP